jgi:polygalacturonase
MKTTLTLLTALLLAPLAALHAADAASESSDRIVNAGDYGLKNIPSDRWDAKLFPDNPDSTDAIQAACDAGAGRTVYIPAGLYRITKPIRVKSGTQVMGAGFCATKISTEKPIAIFHLQKVGGPMTIIRDLWTVGPLGGNWQGTGIWLEGCNGVTIRDCWVNGLGTGIRVDGISDTWLRNIAVEMCNRGIVVECEKLYPQHVAGNLRLTDCYGWQNYQAGISLTNCRGVQIEGGGATGSRYGILAKNCADVTMTGFMVNMSGEDKYRKFGVRLEDCEHVTAGHNIIQGMVEYGLAAVRCKRVTLTANVIRSTGAGPGMIVDQCRLSSVSANIVSGSGKESIAITGSHDLSITGNVVDSYGLAADSKGKTAGIAIDAQSSNCEHVGNIPKPTVGAASPEPKTGAAK